MVPRMAYHVVILVVRALLRTDHHSAGPLTGDEDGPFQYVLSLGRVDLYARNAAVIPDPYDSVYLPASQSKSRRRPPRGLYNPHQKRNNYRFPEVPSAYCPDNNLCCTDTVEDMELCCWYMLSCGVENDDHITPA